jgi:hypothetical protein
LGKHLEVHRTGGINLQASVDAKELGRLGCLMYPLQRRGIGGSVWS